jgi:uncharacterized protein YcbX
MFKIKDMYEVTDIIIYPIKSLGGIHLNMAKALTAGFEFDRRWMLLDANNQFLSQRTIPQMALFSIKISGPILSASYENHTLEFNVHETDGNIIQTKVWDDNASTIEVSKEASNWFSKLFRQDVRLVKIADEKARSHHITKKQDDVHVSLADGYPYLLTGESSLTHLSTKSAIPIAMDRFRPNIVVNAKIPHEEDEWQRLEIGTAVFENIKPCGRCKIITVNQQTAEINNEPLKVLNSYRKSGNNVIFGTNMICTRPGIVSIGDTIIL